MTLPLPEPQKVCWIGHELFTADQMRSYAEAYAADLAEKLEKQKIRADNADGMAMCMEELRNACIKAGALDKSVSPMFMPESIIPRLLQHADLAAKILEPCHKANEDTP